MRWIARIFGLLLVIIVVVAVSVLFLPADRIAKVAADQIRNATGRDVRISGDVSMTLWPVLGVSAGGLEVGNAEWSDKGPMLTAENASLGVDVLALLSGEIRITNIEATRPTIRLESRADGRASWKFSNAGGDASIETGTSPERDPQPVLIQRLEVTDATLIYDAEGSDLVSYSGVDLQLDWPDRRGPAKIAATLLPKDTPVEVTATIGGFAGFITGQVQPVDVTIKAANGTAKLEGRASTVGEVAGRLHLDVPNTDAFLAALALPLPGLPSRLGQSVDLSTELTLTADRRLSLRELNADLRGNTLRGAADIELNGTPRINAQLNAGALNLNGQNGGDGSGSASEGSGWSKSRIDASALAAFNGDIALTASSIDFGRFKIGPTRTLLRNDRSRMVLEIREAKAYEGTLSGEFVINNRSGLSVGGQLFAQSLSMQQVLRDAIGIERLTGAANAEVSFLGVGASVDAIMNSLSGKGAILFGRGTIIGIDLDRLMRSGTVGGGTTVFDSLGASFNIEKGVAHNDDLLLQLSSYEARGQGQIGLGQKTIDYTFTPLALRAKDGTGIAVPVRIRGPWANPRIIPDLEAVLELKLEDEAERVTSKAVRKAQEKVTKELGLTPEDAENIDKESMKKLEKEITKGLRSLFD